MNGKSLANDRRRRKTITLLWALGVSVVVIFLIYKEMTAVLYILATLSVTVLLFIVAFSDLSHADGSSDQLAQGKNASSSADR
jgi:preprotein translocase subunit SecD